MDDRRVGLILRAVRRRRGWRQADLAARAGCSQATVSTIEAGHVDGTPLRALRRLFAALDAGVDLVPRWRGADLDRLLDAAHASIVAVVTRYLAAAAWDPRVEVTYSEFGERGSIDILGLRPTQRAALVVEVKSDMPSAEGLSRKLDEKARLAPRIVADRFGWRPDVVGRVLVLPDSGRLRRLAAIPAIAVPLPADAVAVRRWLRAPAGPLAATWFLPDISLRN